MVTKPIGQYLWLKHWRWSIQIDRSNRSRSTTKDFVKLEKQLSAACKTFIENQLSLA
jgi:hypothetical protein